MRLSKLASIRPGLCIVLLFVWAASASRASAQTLAGWVNPSIGNWFVADNWNPNIPNSGTIAGINNGGLVLLNSPGAAAHQLYLGAYAGDVGFMDVSGPGDLTLGARLYVYNGTFQVVTGGRVVVLDNPIIGRATEIGNSPGTGTVVVSGANSYLTSGTMHLGTYGRGVLRIENGGRIDTGTAFVGNASATITGPNTLWSVNVLNSGNGPSTSAPPVTISNRATVSAGYTTIGGNSTLTVTGAGSSLNNNTASFDTMFIGYGGNGTLSVQNGGLVTGGNADWISVLGVRCW